MVGSYNCVRTLEVYSLNTDLISLSKVSRTTRTSSFTSFFNWLFFRSELNVILSIFSSTRTKVLLGLSVYQPTRRVDEPDLLYRCPLRLRCLVPHVGEKLCRSPMILHTCRSGNCKRGCVLIISPYGLIGIKITLLVFTLRRQKMYG